MQIDLKEFFKKDNKRGHKFTKRWLLCNNPEIISELDKYVKNNSELQFLPYRNQLHHFINNNNKIPNCYCGKEVKLISINLGYQTYCSNKCCQNSIERKNQCKETSLKKYGVEYYTQTEEYLERSAKTNLKKYGNKCILRSEHGKNKTKETSQFKYGVDNSAKSEIVKNKIKQIKLEKYGNENYNGDPKKRSETMLKKYSDENELLKFLNKQKQTNLERYGVENPSTLEEIKIKNQEATKKTLLERYGVDNPGKLPEVIENNREKFRSKYPNLKFLSYDKETSLHEIECPVCTSFKISASLLALRTKENREICTNCNKIDNASEGQISLIEYIKSIYQDELVINDRKILNGLELDIYIPAKNLAIEYNGMYWHSNEFIENDYHLNKTINCENKGIELIHVFEEDWNDKKEIIKSIIFNKLIDNKIKSYDEIKEISVDIANNFLIENSINKLLYSDVCIGLFKDKTLLSVMSFSNKENNIFYLKNFTNVLFDNSDYFNDILNFFIKNNTPSKIIAYSNTSWDNGKLYENFGFNHEYSTIPNFDYLKYAKRHVFNINEIFEYKPYKIYDCGLKKWYLNISI